MSGIALLGAKLFSNALYKPCCENDGAYNSEQYQRKLQHGYAFIVLRGDAENGLAAFVARIKRESMLPRVLQRGSMQDGRALLRAL